MKKRLTFIVLLLGLIMSVGCSKGDDASEAENGGGKDLPTLPDPNDVCSCMDDIVFMQYCYDNFDVNKDGKVSKIEAAAVAKIDLTNLGVRTLTGIEYFSSLEMLNCKNCNQLISANLQYNLKITEIGSEALYECNKLANITIPQTVTKFGYQAFLGCNSLESIILPEKIIEIGSNVFPGCSSLKAIVLPESIINIGSRTFFRCSSLTDIIIPKNVTKIEDYMFMECSSLKSITISEKVTEIEEYAFLFCNNLTNIYCKPSTPPIIFGRLDCNNFVLHVPFQSIEAYKNSPWSNYYSSIKAIE